MPQTSMTELLVGSTSSLVLLLGAFVLLLLSRRGNGPRGLPRALDWRRLAPGTLVFLLFGVCGNGPPPDGTEGSVGGGPGANSRSSCGTTYFYKEQVIHASFRNGTKATGWSQSVELSRYEEKLLRTEYEEEDGDVVVERHDGPSEVGGLLAARVGYHGQHVGGEFGPAFLSDGTGTVPLPTGNLWFGRRDVAYGYVTLLDGAFSNANPSIGVGVGLEIPGGHGTIRGGFGLGGPQLEAHVRVREGLRLGAEACLMDGDNWRAVGRLTFYAPPRARHVAPPAPDPTWTPASDEPVTPEPAPLVGDSAAAPAVTGTSGPP